MSPYIPAMSAREFIKMHGLGNDVVIVDARARPLPIDRIGTRRLADRHTGIGFDQMIALDPADDADVGVRIFNADGAEVEACGNAMRCVARLLMDGKKDTLTIRSQAGLLEASRAGDRRRSFRRGHGSGPRGMAGNPSGTRMRHGPCTAVSRPAVGSGRGQHGQPARSLLGRRPGRDPAGNPWGRNLNTTRCFPSVPTLASRNSWDLTP